MEKSLVLSTGVINLPKNELEIYNASKGELIRNLEDDSLLDLASKVMSLAKFKLGMKDVNASEEQAHILMLVDDIREMQGLTQAEILIGLKKGLNGEYLNAGENVVYFSSSNFVRWIKRYMNDKNEVMRKVANAKQEEPAKPKPCDSVLKAQSIETANMYAKEIWKAQKAKTEFKWIAGGLHILYDYLEEFEIYKAHIDDKRRIAEKYKHLQGEEFKVACKTQAYKEFIISLVDFESKIDNQGKIKPIDE